MFYCAEHAKKNGWPFPDDTSSAFTFPPTSYGPCELCPDRTPKLCADVPSRQLPIPGQEKE